MDEVCVKEEPIEDECEDPLAMVESDHDNVVLGATVKQEPEENLPSDSPFLDKVPFEEISIKPEKIDSFGSSDDNLTDGEFGQTPKLPTSKYKSEGYSAKRLTAWSVFFNLNPLDFFLKKSLQPLFFFFNCLTSHFTF